MLRAALLPILILAACTADTPHEAAAPAATSGAETAAPSDQQPYVQGDSLMIPHDGGFVEFVSKTEFGESMVSYELIGYDEALHGHLVRAAYWEGAEIIHVSRRTGRQTTLHGDLVFSDYEPYIATASIDLEARYSPNRIAIYRVSPDGLEPEWEAGPLWDDPVQWGPEMTTWAGPGTLTFRQVTLLEDGAESVREVTVTRRAAATWQPDVNI